MHKAPLLLDAALPNYQAYAIEEKTIPRIGDGLILESLTLLVQRGQGRGRGMEAYLRAKEIFGDPPRLPGAYLVYEQSLTGFQ